ncbi:MAG: tetratricopeptide repeat protein [Deltaproteobacteria bacterium]|nr:tetratricopeptide repeat protein [Deltaproteobacteria bacterium]MBI4374323.1 tetratricopeptide repeat protein [Deltaproteobacteria bacterium]
MKPKFIGLLVFIVLILGGGTLLLLHKSPKKLPSFTAEEASELATDRARIIREMGEEGLKKKQYLPLIKVYEDLLTQYPDSKDLKRKLAESYEEVGELEKAKKLLDEIN